MKSTFWILGIALVVVMFVGAKMLLSGSPTPDGSSAVGENLPPPNMVIAWGYFDGEKGVAGLDPSQPGRVTFVAPENTRVKKGDLLLQIDDTIPKLKVDAARDQLALAKQLTELYRLQAVEAEATLASVVREAMSAITRLKNSGGSSAQIQEAELQLADKKKAGEAKIEQIKLQSAPLKIALAQTQRNEAEAMVKLYQIVAPDDGTVLRVNVRKDEILGPGAMRHAVEFLPEAPIIVKAEVMQEWGRYIKVGEKVDIEDDTYHGPHWKGTIKSVSEWYAQIRHPVIEPFRMNDVRTLDCVIAVQNAEGARIGQRVRAKISIGNVEPK